MRQATATSAARPPLPAAPVVVLFAAFPLWWALGLAGLVWLAAAPLLLLLLLAHQRPRVPRGFGVWLAFLLWMAGSGLELDSMDRALGFAWRAGLYLSATALFVYVYNASARTLPARVAAGALTMLWLAAVAGGWLGVLRPEVSFRTPVEAAMPSRLLGNELVRELVHPGVVEAAPEGAAPRPKAPFSYTNEWGGNVAVLLPLVLLTVTTARSIAARGALWLALVASLVPMFLSLNRGLWLSLGIGLAYAALRLAARGRLRALLVVLTFVLAAAVLTVAVPVQELITARVATTNTNQTRLALYRETLRRSIGSPLLGYGAPRPSDQGPGQPSLGTQGQLWTVLFSQGAPGLGLFAGWLALALWRSRRARTTTQLWTHVALLIALVQLPFYGYLPVELHVIMVAAALAWREEVPA